MTKKITTSVKLPVTLEQKLLEQVIRDGYGMKGKSRWIAEAIESFLALPNYPELVEIADEMENLLHPISMRLPEELTNKIDLAILEVRKLYPGLEGVKSNLVRASILQRLIGNPLRSP